MSLTSNANPAESLPFTQEPETILRHPENESLISALSQFAETLKRYGFQVPAYSSFSLVKLPQVPYEKKMEIARSFELWNQWIKPEPMLASSVDPIPLDSNRERAFAEEALNYYKLKIDEDFWKTLGNDHVIEIYGKDMIQLYRSLNFFKYCGYSLLDISINEWFVLWNRPTQVIRAMEGDVIHTLQNNLGVYKSTVPRHILTETLNSGETQSFVPRTSVVDFQYLGTLHKENSTEPYGFICTAAGSVLLKGDQTLEIGFI